MEGYYMSDEAERDRVAADAGLPSCALRTGETFVPLGNVAQVVGAGDPGLSAEDALGVKYIAD
jgi:hypothetical protein